MVKKFFFMSILTMLLATPVSSQEVLQERIVLYLFKPDYNTFINDKIEEMTLKSVVENFSKEMDDGLLEVKEVNITLPENKNFVKKYKLNSNGLSVVLVKMHNFKDVKYKNLTDIWKYSSKQEMIFKKYITKNIKRFIQK